MSLFPSPRQTGFTLMEVLVAVAVVAIALTAILGSSGRTVSNAISLRDTTLAQWVAENRLSEIRLSGDWPSTGRSDGESEMAGREWFWEMEVDTTDDEDLRRVEIAVASERDSDRHLVRITAFIGRPMPVNPPVFIPSEEVTPEDEGTTPPAQRGGRR